MPVLDSKTITYIDSSTLLQQHCLVWRDKPCLALDTEFVRTNTFYPKPGVIQLADDSGIYLVDPVAIEDLSALHDIISDSGILWILHSGSEDLVLLLSLFGALPKRIFDTQVAAAYLGLGFSLSYQRLVNDVLQIDVQKGETRSDWLQRPLSDSQLEYAAADVQYLLQLHSVLTHLMLDSPLNAWLEEDMQQLLVTARKTEDTDCWPQLYADVSNSWRLSTPELIVLQALCIWREQEARSRNKPRSWIATDKELLAISRAFGDKQGLTLNDLNSIPELSSQLRRRYGKSVVARTVNLPNEQSIDRKLLSHPLSPRYRKTLKNWQKIVLRKSEELDIAPELVARKRWLQDLLKSAKVSGSPQWQPPLTGWRRNLLQQEFEQVLQDS